MCVCVSVCVYVCVCVCVCVFVCVGVGVTLVVINHSITHLSEFRQVGEREGKGGVW